MGCSRSGSYPAPAEPEAAVRAFMNAVAANSMVAMGELWGTSRGPAVGFMDRDQLEKRLTVIRAYLEHERFEIIGTSTSVSGNADERQLQVRIVRRGCTPVVPMTMVRYRSGWLVSDVNLEAAGNPAQTCQ